MNNKAFILINFFLAFSFGCKQPSEKLEDSKYRIAIEESHRLLDSVQQHCKIPGLDVAVSIESEVVWAEGFGMADLEHNVPIIQGKTRFRIGSVSKTLTAAAVGRLVDKGKIKLDTIIQAYVPYFPIKRYPITIRQIGSHLAGIRHYEGDEFLNTTRYNSVKSSLKIFKNDPLLFQPGINYSYSSYGYNLLSAAIEGASGMNFLSLMQKEVFNELNMNSTCADKNDSIIHHRTSFYHVDSLNNIINAPYVDNSYKWAGGGFLSSTTDLIKFGEAHLNNGFLSEITLNTLTKPQVLQNGDSTGYGLGWFIKKNNQSKMISHNGGSVGGKTYYRIYPEEEFVFVLLTNSFNGTYHSVIDRIIKSFLDSKSDRNSKQY